MPYTYMLRCSDGSFYVGSTWDLEGRIWQHNNCNVMGAAYTRRRRPVVLVWNEEFDRIDDAYHFEKMIQGWGRKKREALIRGDYEALPALSRRKAVQDREVSASDDEPRPPVG